MRGRLFPHTRIPAQRRDMDTRAVERELDSSGPGYHNDNNARETSRGNNDLYSKQSASVKLAVFVMKFFFVLLVTACLVLSKLTIIETFAKLNLLVNISAPRSDKVADVHPDLRKAARIYWQLLIIVMVPSLLTWSYSVFKGVFSRSLNHPWPKKSAIILVSSAIYSSF